MLPPIKSGTPKCLYLDQNKWIELARADNRLDDGRLRPVLELIEHSISRGTIVVPLSDVHMLETVAAGGLDRRNRLARTMVRLSRNLAIRPAHIVQKEEISCAVLELIGIPLNYEIRPTVVSTGIGEAVGIRAEATGKPDDVAKFNAHLFSSEFTVYMLTDENLRTHTAGLRDQESIAAKEQDKRRLEALSELSEDERLQVDVLGLMKRDDVSNRIVETLTLLNLPPNAAYRFLSSYQDHLRFIRSVPTLDVLLTLSQERYKAPARKTHRNDHKDIGFLRVAIPYANFVVTERYWAHVANQTGLAEKYDTSVISKLEDLPQLLSYN